MGKLVIKVEKFEVGKEKQRQRSDAAFDILWSKAKNDEYIFVTFQLCVYLSLGLPFGHSRCFLFDLGII